MEQLGYLVRADDPQDHRSKRIRLTKRGRAACRGGPPCTAMLVVSRLGVRLAICALPAACIAAAACAPASAATNRRRELRSPSGAIECVVDVAGSFQEATCESAYTRAHHLKQDCGSGSAVVVHETGRSSYEPLCGVLTIDPQTLAYGHSVTIGQLRCGSARSGITCRSLASGHGFTLSREHLRQF